LLLLLCSEFRQYLTALKASDCPAACAVSKAQFPLSFFGLYKEKLSKPEQQSILLFIKIKKSTNPKPQLLQVTSP